MKVLHLCSYYPTSTLYSFLFDAIGKTGVEQIVYIPIRRLLTAKIEHHKDLVYSPVLPRWTRPFFFLKVRKLFYDFERRFDMRKISVDLFHAHSLFMNGYLAWKLRKKYGIPYIVAVRNTDVNVFYKYMVHLRGLGRKILDDAERVVFLSPEYKKKVITSWYKDNPHLREEAERKSVVIPNGVADVFFSESSSSDRANRSSSETRILFVGKIDKNKNITALIDALEILSSQKVQVKLDIVGKAIDEKIMKRIRGCCFAQWYGEKKTIELIQFYRQCDILAVPSLKETFGIVYPEAMSQGAPVIYTRGQGFDGYFTEGHVGYSVNAEDPHSIVDAMQKILKNRDVISKNARKESQRFKWDKIGVLYTQLYRDSVPE